MKPRIHTALLLAAACGPVVDVDETASTTLDATTTTASPTTTAAPTCTAEAAQACVCPDGAAGTQTCLPTGDFGPCACPRPSTDTETSTTGDPATESGGSSDSGGSSTGPPPPLECPEFPAPCGGTAEISDDTEFTDISMMCTSLDGRLILNGSVSTVDSLGCMTELGELRIEGTTIADLSGLARLEHLETLVIEDASVLTHIGLPQLRDLARITVTGNAALEQLDFPALTSIEWTVQITDNPSLSNCEVEALLEQVGGTNGDVCYETNANDGCPPSCP